MLFLEFVPCIDQLFDESLLVGTGWTTRDTVRSLAYSILADLVHHIRSSLSLPQLSSAVHLFSKNVHDDTFPVSIQTMSCKVKIYLFFVAQFFVYMCTLKICKFIFIIIMSIAIAEIGVHKSL